MLREKTHYTTHFQPVMDTLTGPGLLLGSYDAARKPNLMTIGWGSLGSIWGEPIWIVLVRPSRYTHVSIEHSGCFTVNVPTPDLGMACAICGSRSGRDTDKFAQCRLTAEQAQNVLAPTIAECPIVYECQVVHDNDIQPKKLADEIFKGAYQDGDFHTVYFGKILGTYAAADAAEQLA